MKKIILTFILISFYSTSAMAIEGSISTSHERTVNGDNTFVSDLHLNQKIGIFNPYSDIQFEYGKNVVNHKMGVETEIYPNLKLDVGAEFDANYSLAYTNAKIIYNFSTDSVKK